MRRRFFLASMAHSSYRGMLNRLFCLYESKSGFGLREEKEEKATSKSRVSHPNSTRCRKVSNEVIRNGTLSSTHEALRQCFPSILLFGNQHIDATPLRSWGTTPHVGGPPRRPQYDCVS